MPKSDSTPGPATPTRAADAFTAPIPSPPVQVGDDVALDQLSPDEIRARLAARERDLKYHVQALRHEAATVIDDVNVGGRPLMDIIRGNPVLSVVTAVGTGALVGLVLGLRARAKRRPPTDDEIDFVRARLALALEDAAQRVAAGTSVEVALRRSLDTVPVMYADASEVEPAPRSTRHQVFDVVMTSVAGFAAKSALDLLTQRLTGHEETFSAVADAVDDD